MNSPIKRQHTKQKERERDGNKTDGTTDISFNKQKKQEESDTKSSTPDKTFPNETSVNIESYISSTNKKRTSKKLQNSPKKSFTKSVTNKKKGVTFKKKFVDVVYVESFKKYNENMCDNDDKDSTVKCKCLIF